LAVAALYRLSLNISLLPVVVVGVSVTQVAEAAVALLPEPLISMMNRAQKPLL